MKVKKYTVFSIQEGWRKIKEELGENAIILSVKEYNGAFEILATSPSISKEVENIKDEKQKLIKLKSFVEKLTKTNISQELLGTIEEEIIQIYSVIVDNISNISLKDRIKTNPLTKYY